jgi:hypothetical protein
VTVSNVFPVPLCSSGCSGESNSTRGRSSCRLPACSRPGAAGTLAPPRVRAAAMGAAAELPAPAIQGPGLEVQRAQDGVEVL